jgi:hypothetical protein
MPTVSKNQRVDWEAAMRVSANACVSDRRQRETDSRTEPSVEAASCSLDAMVRQDH